MTDNPRPTLVELLQPTGLTGVPVAAASCRPDLPTAPRPDPTKPIRVLKLC